LIHIQSFKPIVNIDAEILILGTMPGCASLNAGQYYAHKQNTFWRIISELLKLDVSSFYEVKVQAVKSARIAVWDVLQSCKRKGSLDSMIDPDSLIPNDFYTFFQHHRKITHIFFNGAKAESYFLRHAMPSIEKSDFTFSRLPSTSPANASMSYEHKLNAWRVILDTKNKNHEG
jgi:hypoxanthine-DNA glycosylase